ncbi:MAG: winged helix-turn-helix domain-containing protein [Gammaproteobacteria bacterium]|jgi:hypothetical protein
MKTEITLVDGAWLFQVNIVAVSPRGRLALRCSFETPALYRIDAGGLKQLFNGAGDCYVFHTSCIPFDRRGYFALPWPVRCPCGAEIVAIIDRPTLQVPLLGTIVPNMGTLKPKQLRLGDVLFSKTQQRVLGLLFSDPDRSYYAKEIVRFAGVGIGSVYRELEKLTAVGLITMKKIGHQKYYQANRQSLIFEELAVILHKVSDTEKADIVQSGTVITDDERMT